MTELAQATLSEQEARSLTDEVKRDAERLWAKLLELYEGGAHGVLGYSSWGTYFEAEFGGSDATAYRLLQSARVVSELPIGSRPVNEAQARELAPLLDKPEELRETWAEVVEETNGQPTAAATRELVTRSTGRKEGGSKKATVSKLKKGGTCGRAGRVSLCWRAWGGRRPGAS